MQNIRTRKTSHPRTRRLPKKKKEQWGTESSKFFSCLFCSYCGTSGSDLSEHYVGTHGIEVRFHQLVFNCYDDFKVWRTYALSQYNYMSEWPPNDKGMGCSTCILFAWCKEGVNFRKSPVDMFRGCCPASVRALCKDDRTIVVEYVSTHLGHNYEINENELHDPLQATGELTVESEEQCIDFLEIGPVKIEQVSFCTMGDSDSKIHEADTISVKVEEGSSTFDSFLESGNTNFTSAHVKDEPQDFSTETQLSRSGSGNDPTQKSHQYEEQCPNENQPPVSDSGNLTEEPNSLRCDPPEQDDSVTNMSEDKNSTDKSTDSEFSILTNQCVSVETDKPISSLCSLLPARQPLSNRRVSERLRLKRHLTRKESSRIGVREVKKLPSGLNKKLPVGVKKLPVFSRESNTDGKYYFSAASPNIKNENCPSFLQNNVEKNQTKRKRVLPCASRMRRSVGCQTPLGLFYDPGPEPLQNTLDSDLPRKCYSNKKKSNISQPDSLSAEKLPNENAKDLIPFHKPPEKESGSRTIENGLLNPRENLSTCFIEDTSNRGEVVLDAPIGSIEPSSLIYRFDEDVFTLAEDDQKSDVSSKNGVDGHTCLQYDPHKELRSKQRIRNNLLGRSGFRNRLSLLKIKRLRSYKYVTSSKTDGEETNGQAGELSPEPNSFSPCPPKGETYSTNVLPSRISEEGMIIPSSNQVVPDLQSRCGLFADDSDDPKKAIQSSTVSSDEPSAGIDMSLETSTNFIKPIKAYHNSSKLSARRKQVFIVNDPDVSSCRHLSCSTPRSITSDNTDQKTRKNSSFITGTDLL